MAVSVNRGSFERGLETRFFTGSRYLTMKELDPLGSKGAFGFCMSHCYDYMGSSVIFRMDVRILYKGVHSGSTKVIAFNVLLAQY